MEEGSERRGRARTRRRRTAKNGSDAEGCRRGGTENEEGKESPLEHLMVEQQANDDNEVKVGGDGGTQSFGDSKLDDPHVGQSKVRNDRLTFPSFDT